MDHHPPSTAYLRDLLDQPRALEETLNSLEGLALPPSFAGCLAGGRFSRVVLTGMGSSYYAFHPLHQALIRRGVEAHLVEGGELLHALAGLLRPGTLVIAASQSGRSAETVGLLERRGSGFALLGVSNTPGSPLAEGADACILTRAGEEATVSCKTYLAALAALAWLEPALFHEDPAAALTGLRAAVPAARDYLAGWQAHVADLEARLRSARDLFLVGRGPSLASVGTGGLIVKEAAHLHAEGMTGAAFRHGPFEMTSPEAFVLVFAGQGPGAALNRRLYEDVRKAGGAAGWVGEDADEAVLRLAPVAEAARPLLEILPVQMTTLALAGLKGHEAGRFRLGSKVTTVA